MYLALYRKYRPKSFSDVVSQEHITTTLVNQLRTGQIAHAYLFTGTRGTGKTTCAKILAKAVNCTNPQNGNPCMECESCRRIDEGSTDIMEIDAASNNGIDDVRALRDEIVYTPIDCRYKVYIIDEVHMLSVAAFNALLKTIEEPPAHVIFILATTDVHKVPATILSRCQRFQFRKINPADSAALLMKIAVQENITLREDAAFLISRLSDGAMRDALSLLDQCISAAQVGAEVTVQVVRECSGTAGKEELFAISEAVRRNNSVNALAVVSRLSENSKDMTKLIEELVLHFRNLMLLKVSPGSPLVTAFPDEIELYEEQARGFSLEMIMRCLNILSDSLDNINRMKQTAQARVLVEMLVIKLCTPKLDSDASALSLRIDALEEKLKNASAASIPAAADIPAVAVVRAPIAVADIPVEAESAEEAPDLPEPPVERQQLREEAPAPEYDEPPVEERKAPGGLAPIVSSDVTASQLDENSAVREWNEVIDLLPITMSGILEDSKAFFLGEKIILVAGSTAKTILADPDRAEKLRAAAAKILGKDYMIMLAEEEKEEKKEDRTEAFLNLAEEKGVPVKRV